MGAVICPTVTAYSIEEYNAQIKRLTPFTKRVHLDLMDGEFAPTVSPKLEDIWWPPSMEADIHLMYQRPMDYLPQLLHLKPRMVIIHVEAMFHHMHFAAELHKEGIEVGLAILPETPIANVEQILNSFDHLLLFSGHLGHFGGVADLGLLQKVEEARLHHPDLEFGWDGGINTENVAALVAGGINVLNTGGAIQKAEDPAKAYETLVKTIS